MADNVNNKTDDPKTSFRDFPGLQTAVDSKDISLGASLHQVNVSAAYPGELRVRGGCKLVVFASQSS